MFHLESSIENWRAELSSLSTDDRRELETHLRDEIERQMKSGADARTAFEVAAKKIGNTGRLKLEFGKGMMSRWEKIMVLAALCGFTLFAAIFKPGNASEMTFAQQLSCLVSAPVGIFLSFIGKWGDRYFPGIIDEKKRAAAGILIVFLMCAGSTALLYNTNDLTMSQLFVAVLWGLNIFIGFSAALMEGLDRAARKKLEETNYV